MKLSNLINPKLVLLKQPCRTHDELIDMLIKELYRGSQNMALPEDVVRKAVMSRETLQGTLLPTGLSMPHARLDGIADLTVVIGVPEEPIPTRGNTPINMMILMLSSHLAATKYLNTLAAFAKLSNNEIFQKLCREGSPDNFIKIIDDANIDITKDLTVATIMSTTIKVLHPDNTVREAMDMFYKDRLGYVPIIDSNDIFVGELTMTDLFSICIPAYALKLQNLKFLSNFEPLEDLLRNENNIRIGDVMKKPSVMLEQDSPVVEAVLKFVQCRRRYLPVVKKDTHLIGVVGYMDVLKKVLRA
jgi:PTS system nitrogen regulatory IIA component